MSGWLGWFAGPRDTKKPAREAIIKLRQNLQLLERKEDHLQRQIDDQQNVAKNNAINKPEVAKAALRRKKILQGDLDKLSGQKFTLEAQVNALESANLNQETLEAMKAGASALEVIHNRTTVEQVDVTMDAIREQMQVANEISTAISNPIVGDAIDEDELNKELAELEEEELHNRLEGADRVPVHTPSKPIRESAAPVRQSMEDEEEEQLRALQAELAMS